MGTKDGSDFRAGWIAAMEACGETDIDPDADPAYQVAEKERRVNSLFSGRVIGIQVPASETIDPVTGDGSASVRRVGAPNHEAQEELEALRDMLSDARMQLDMLREALGVPVEPHQHLLSRMLDAATRRRGERAQQPVAWRSSSGGEHWPRLGREGAMGDSPYKPLANILNKAQGRVCKETGEEIDVGGDVVKVREHCDRLRDENAQLRGLLKEAADDIEETVEATYYGMDRYPDQQRRKERDMDLPRRIRAALEDNSDGALSA